jgi:hypothetical protein
LQAIRGLGNPKAAFAVIPARTVIAAALPKRQTHSWAALLGACKPRRNAKGKGFTANGLWWGKMNLVGEHVRQR